MLNPETSLCLPGDRIECGNYFGTVKYVGLLEGKPGTWLGVDWDDPERGKHNGSANGVQYFTTKHASSGSFLRPEKANLGKSVLASIRSRYGQLEDEFTAKVNAQKHLLMQQTINAPFLEMVGFDKVFSRQSDFATLKVVNLRNQNVSSIGDAKQLAESCPMIEEIDLSKNLLPSWSCIFELCTHLRHLAWINVSENRMEMPDDYIDYEFDGMRTVICGTMGLNWYDLVQIGTIFVNVEELICPNNQIRCLEEVDGCFRQLKHLDLEGNGIEDWNEICKLDSIKSIEHINLENTGIYSIDFYDNGLKTKYFRNLQKLCLVNNFIFEWKSFNQLDRLASLINLKILKNPIFKDQEMEAIHQHVIAKIENLQVLNGVEISKQERRGAEIDYMKKFGLEWLAVKETERQDDFLSTHPRFLQLIEIYGEPEEAELLQKPKIIQTSLIKLAIIYNRKVIFKRVPPSMSVHKLMILAQKLFKLNDRPTLSYVSGKDSNIHIDLNEDLKEIGIYSMQDDDKIIVTL